MQWSQFSNGDLYTDLGNIVAHISKIDSNYYLITFDNKSVNLDLSYKAVTLEQAKTFALSKGKDLSKLA